MTFGNNQADQDMRMDGRGCNEPVMSAECTTPMNRITLSFSDPLLERLFLSDYSGSIIGRVRTALILGAVLYAMFGLLDWLIIPDIRHIAWFIRYAAVCPLLTAVYIATHASWFRTVMQPAIALSVSAAGAGIIIMIELAGNSAAYIYYGGLILVVMFAFILSGLRFINATGVSAAILAGYVAVTLFHGNAETVLAISNYFFLVSAITVGMFSGYLVERHVRMNFLQRRNISGMVEQLKNEAQERSSALQTLSESKEKYHALMESSADAMILTDLSGNLLEVNRQAEELFGCDRNQLQDMNIADFHSGKEKKDIEYAYRELPFIKRYRLNNTQVNAADGRVIPVDISVSMVSYGQKEAIIGSYRNITPYKKIEETLRWYQEGLEVLISDRTAELRQTVDDLKKEVSDRILAEEALRRNKLFLRSIFDNIMDGIIVLDPDLNVKMVNRAVESWFPDMKSFRFRDRKCFEVLYKRDMKCEPCIAVQAMHTGEVSMKTYRGSDDRGRRVAREIYAFPFRDDDGVIVGAIEYIRDVTAKLEAEESAGRTHHLAQLGQLSAGIAHEINNPNNVIMCNSQLLSDIWDDAYKVLLKYYSENGDFLLAGSTFSESAAGVAESIRGITKCSRRIDDIVVNLKDYAGHKKSVTSEWFNINKAVTNAMLIVSGLIRKRTDRICVDLSSDMPLVFGSISAIEQVAVNLLTNALYALPDRTKGIFVSTRSDEDKGYAILEIRDEGVGMDELTMARIYDPFFTTRYDHGGTGLGLGIAQTIVRNHEGVLQFRSEPGLGTVVRMVLPASCREGQRIPE